MSGDQLQVLTEFDRRLASIDTVAEGKKLRDAAEAFRHFAKTARKGIEVQNRCAVLRRLAERKVGELLGKLPRAAGPGRGKKNETAPKSFLKTLKNEGISYDDARDWQLYAQVPEAAFRRQLEAATRDGSGLVELTGVDVAHVVRRYAESHMTPAEREAQDQRMRETMARVTRKASELWDKITEPDFVSRLRNPEPDSEQFRRQSPDTRVVIDTIRS